MNRSFDVVIVGAGPAGCATAIAVLQESACSVALINPARRPCKVFGESLSPAAKPSLAKLGLADKMQACASLPCYGNRALWSEQLSVTDFMLHPYSSGWFVDRSAFDQMMLSEARESGATVFDRTALVGVHEADGEWNLQVKQDGKLIGLCGTIVIDASGLSASFCRRIGIKRKVLDQMFCQSWILPAARQPCRFSTVEAFDDGWLYAAPFPGERLSLMFMSDTHTIDARSSAFDLQGLAATSKLIAPMLGDKFADSDAKPRVLLAQTSHVQQYAGRNWLAVGDAAFAIDPVLASGLSRTLEQACLAGTYVRKLLDDHVQCVEHAAQYHAMIAQSLYSNLKMRQHVYSLQPRRTAFWQNRLRIEADKEGLENEFSAMAQVAHKQERSVAGAARGGF